MQKDFHFGICSCTTHETVQPIATFYQLMYQIVQLSAAKKK